MLKINWDIGKDHHIFWASSAVGYQFFSLIGAVYQLYSEGPDNHSHNRGTGHHADFYYHGNDESLRQDEYRIKTSFDWNGCGPYYTFTFSRKFKHPTDPSEGMDLIEISITSTRQEPHIYTVDGHDLCYAVAKAYTKAIKKYGFYGYYSSTGGNCNGFGDAIDLHMILFIKAYALHAMEIRELKTVWKDERRWEHAEGTSFDREIELLLFDM